MFVFVSFCFTLLFSGLAFVESVWRIWERSSRNGREGVVTRAGVCCLLAGRLPGVQCLVLEVSSLHGVIA